MMAGVSLGMGALLRPHERPVAALAPNLAPAGFTWDGVIHKMTDEQWAAMLAVHCTAPFKLIQAATPHMRDAAKRDMEAQGAAQPRWGCACVDTWGTHINASCVLASFLALSRHAARAPPLSFLPCATQLTHITCSPWALRSLDCGPNRGCLCSVILEVQNCVIVCVFFL